ncbi:MAG: dihydropyrimidinase [Sedimentibacter sp.]
MLDLVIKNGKIVNWNESIYADIGIQNGKIVCIGNRDSFSETAKEIDATGKLVMPGLIDSHVHIGMELGEFTSLDSFEDGTIAAAYGGTTSMVEFSIPVGNQTSLEALQKSIEIAKGNSIIDYSFHGCVTNSNEQTLHEVKEMITGGIPSIKMFTVYRDTVMLELDGVSEVLKVIAQNNGIAKIHAESAPIIEAMIKKHVDEGKLTPYYHAKSRPTISESSAVAGLIPIAEFIGAPIIFVHMTSASVRDYIKDAKSRSHIYTEFCPHYLTLTEEVYNRIDAQNFVCSPPMRSQVDCDELWHMIKDGLCDTINSDHSAYDTKQKNQYKDYFPRIPNGLPGIETRGNIMFSEGVMKGRMTENQFVQLLSTNDSKLMGLYPRKGIISIGADADIILLDPDAKYIMKATDLHMSTDYTPFEGFELTGKVTHTIIRGNVIINDSQYVNKNFRGNFIKRHSPVLY